MTILAMMFEVDGHRERRYAAIEGGELVGVGSLANAGRPAATVYQLCVAANRRGEGRGTLLLKWMEADAAEMGAEAMSAIVADDGPIGFYAANGYKACHCEGEKVVMSKRLSGDNDKRWLVDEALAARCATTSVGERAKE